jgi:hypothetical protein
MENLSFSTVPPLAATGKLVNIETLFPSVLRENAKVLVFVDLKYSIAANIEEGPIDYAEARVILYTLSILEKNGNHLLQYFPIIIGFEKNEYCVHVDTGIVRSPTEKVGKHGNYRSSCRKRDGIPMDKLP